MHKLLPLCLLPYLLCSCAPPMQDSGNAASPSGRPIYITDRTGERFDIAHAATYYGMHPEGFQYGLGKNAIRPLDHPDMSALGDPDYPDPRAAQQVIGVAVEDDVRSYPIRWLTPHEIVNETIGGTQAAVAY